MDLDDLSKPERALWAAFPNGGWVDLRSGDHEEDDPANADCWGKGRTVRAQVVTALLLGARDLERGSFPAVRLRGARVTGRLDLMGAVVSHALVLEGCRFDEPPRFVETTTKTIRFVDSYLPAFNGARMRTEGILNFYRSVVDGTLRLDRAQGSGARAETDQTGTLVTFLLALYQVGIEPDPDDVAVPQDMTHFDEHAHYPARFNNL